MHHCLQAIESLNRHPQVVVRKRSSWYRTQPVGMTQQAWFINGVVECDTSLEPESLLELNLSIERDSGRDRQVRWGPRTLDLDILAFGDRRISLSSLTIPHPRLHERRFVLIPLVEIAPYWVHPVFKVSATELLARLNDQTLDQKVERMEAS